VRFWRRPRIVLDEPAAHLDAETARKLVDDVIDALGGKTLLVTHRPKGSSAWTIVEPDGAARRHGLRLQDITRRVWRGAAAAG
jgi:ABC-type transport system involved in cytochrome bd biosynthesis fused ATPase/permease subunit